MAESGIQVGIRIRPLLKIEHLQKVSLNTCDSLSQSIEFKKQIFTFDHVFGPDLSQQQLYQNTAAPMLKSFLEGFNVTIIAYGQTGSGKTYSMGTGESYNDLPDNKGLIPRFLCDLFENLKQSATEQKVEALVKISFLEIYGENISDLLIPCTFNSAERGSLKIRENDQGIFAVGQQYKLVQSAEDALQLLYSGSRNRVTGSTTMNAVSSRSHAVFTISLEQKIQSSAHDDDCHQIVSKLTFVDLAGSEKMKVTGAEGQRMKEGIQINTGLFYLGQVINELANDQRMKAGLGNASHIPYRNSKLTHLLKDALGGNSQTLFLACVSPAESNKEETYTTLTYARQARNIKNKPIRNMDPTQQELRRLRLTAKLWMLKAVTNIFGSNNSLGISSSFGSDDDDSILTRTDVKEYIDAMNKFVQEKISGTGPTPRKIRLSIFPTPTPATPFGTNKKSRRLLLHPLTPMTDLPCSIRDAEFREWNSSDLNDATVVISGSDNGLHSKQHSMMSEQLAVSRRNEDVLRIEILEKDEQYNDLQLLQNNILEENNTLKASLISHEEKQRNFEVENLRIKSELEHKSNNHAIFVKNTLDFRKTFKNKESEIYHLEEKQRNLLTNVQAKLSNVEVENVRLRSELEHKSNNHAIFVKSTLVFRKTVKNKESEIYHTLEEYKENRWDFWYSLLLEYRKNHDGDCRVPQRYEVKLDGGRVLRLGRWLINQRQLHKRKQLPERRRKLLQNLVNQGSLKWFLTKKILLGLRKK